ncbi:MAG: molybdopterin-dependent oxidoreductase [Desulfomonilaceae bacterium]
MNTLTRRDFLRLAGAMGGASLFAGCHLFAGDVFVPEYIQGAPGPDPLENLVGVRNVYSVCALCPGNCGIRCRVAQGTLVKIGGSPFHPAATTTPLPADTPLEEALHFGGSICAEGGAGIQTLYDPFRIIKPLKRAGKRGSGKWTAISWDQAITEIIEGGNLFGEGPAPGLKTLRGSPGALQFLLGRADWGATIFVKRWAAAFGAAALVRNREAQLQELAAMAGDEVFGDGTGPLDADYDRAGCVISFGDAPLDSGVPLVATARRIADARAKAPSFLWAVVDPRLSTSASKSDLWAPAIPGKDRELALGIMRSFMERHAELLMAPREDLENLVAGNSADFYAQACGLPVEIVNRLADFLAQGGPSSAVIPGRAIYAQPNGLDAAKTILMLNVMVGARPGVGGLAKTSSPFFARAEKQLVVESGIAQSAGGSDPRAVIVWQADPVYENPHATLQRLGDPRRTPLLLAIEREMTETAALADYILPDVTYLERWDICQSPPAVACPGFGVRAPVVGAVNPRNNDYLPLFPETKIAEDILGLLGAKLGLEGYRPDARGRIKNAWSWFHEELSALWAAMQQEGGFEKAPLDAARVIARGGFFAADSRPQPPAPQRRASLSGVAAAKQAPVLIGPQGEDLILVAFTLPFYRSSRSVIQSWLLEVMPENRLLMNTEDARRRGVRQGDRIRIKALDGSFSGECRVHIVPGIRPGVAALARGYGHTQFGAPGLNIDNKSLPGDKTRGKGVNADALLANSGSIRLLVAKA